MKYRDSTVYSGVPISGVGVEGFYLYRGVLISQGGIQGFHCICCIQKPHFREWNIETLLYTVEFNF